MLSYISNNCEEKETNYFFYTIHRLTLLSDRRRRVIQLYKFYPCARHFYFSYSIFTEHYYYTRNTKKAVRKCNIYKFTKKDGNWNSNLGISFANNFIPSQIITPKKTEITCMGSIHIIKGMACVVSSTTFNLWFSINKKVQKICLYISLF